MPETRKTKFVQINVLESNRMESYRIESSIDLLS